MRWELVDWRMDVCEQFFSDRLFVLSLDKERSLDIANYKEKFQFQHLISIACVVALTIFLWHAVESSSTMLWWKLKWKLRRWLALLWHSSQTHSSVLCSVLNHFTIEYSWSGMSEISLKFFWALEIVVIWMQQIAESLDLLLLVWSLFINFNQISFRSCFCLKRTTNQFQFF